MKTTLPIRRWSLDEQYRNRLRSTEDGEFKHVAESLKGARIRIHGCGGSGTLSERA